MNQMNDIKIEKITLNMGVGEAGNSLKKAMKLLDSITGMKSVETKTKKRIPTWGVRPGLAIGCKVTIRKKTEEFLKRLLVAKEGLLKKSNFSEGTISFGIHEYIDIPGSQYHADIGILGLDVSVTLQRPGYRIKRRAYKKKNVGVRHLINQEEAINFMKEKFNVRIEE